MNTKVWYFPYFEGVYHTRMIETISNANTRMVQTSYYACIARKLQYIYYSPSFKAFHNINERILR